MAQDYISVKIVGPGSQPEDPDGLAADFDNMPDEMHTYSAPILPEPEDTKGLDQALQHAALLQQALDQCDINSANNPAIELDQLDRQNREFFDQILGEGEVGIQANGSVNAHCQESLLAGVWRVQYHRPDGVVYKDTVEVGAIPNLVKHHGFNGAQANIAPN
ncbi:MAG: hydrogenase expression/formation protein, partial [Cellvibrionaceae bacterium]|nr:hydrogenase expression/formation protein [Cellvibrionaceae bacterium]